MGPSVPQITHPIISCITILSNIIDLAVTNMGYIRLLQWTCLILCKNTSGRGLWHHIDQLLLSNQWCQFSYICWHLISQYPIESLIHFWMLTSVFSGTLLILDCQVHLVTNIKFSNLNHCGMKCQALNAPHLGSWNKKLLTMPITTVMLWLAM